LKRRSTDQSEPSQIQCLSEKIVRLEEQLKYSTQAVDTAKKEIDRRLEGMNELRTQITAERGNFISRVEYESKHEVLRSGIEVLQKFQWTMTGAVFIVQIGMGLVLKYWK
jgi:hypothetical protein